MHPVIQFLSHMFGGTPNPNRQGSGQLPPSANNPKNQNENAQHTLQVPQGYNEVPSTMQRGAMNAVLGNPEDAARLQPQLAPRAIAMGHIQNMMSSYDHLQAMMPQALKHEIPTRGAPPPPIQGNPNAYLQGGANNLQVPGSQQIQIAGK